MLVADELVLSQDLFGTSTSVEEEYLHQMRIDGRHTHVSHRVNMVKWGYNDQETWTKKTTRRFTSTFYVRFFLVRHQVLIVDCDVQSSSHRGAAVA